MLVDYMCDVAQSRIRRPVVPFNNPLCSLVRAVTRYAGERMLKEWECATNPMRAVGVGHRFKVIEEMCGRKLIFKVDLRKRVCTCFFHQLNAMPCRHLVFACLQAKTALGKFLREF